MLRFGVLGTARVVPYALLGPATEVDGVEIVGVASRTLQRAEEFAAQHGISRGFGSYEALLQSPDVDAVYIALPPALHYEWARRALEAGKHVLCEKPLAENAQRAEQLAQCAKQNGRVLLEGMHVRYLDRLRRLREVVTTGELGRLRRIESFLRTPYMRIPKGDFRLRFDMGGGAALDLGCYAVSCLRYVAAEEPEVVSVRHKCSSPQVDRWMQAMVRFPSGADGLVEFGFRGLYSPRNRIVATCENGTVKSEGEELVYTKNGQESREAFTPQPTFTLQLREFVKSAAGEKSNALPPEDAVATARVLDAIYEKAGLSLRGTSQAS